ncbi:MAG: beta-hexosaminidase [Shinella sp.]|nr:MAG: beta-hexosaminidase [Shinella sp.]
MDSTIQRDARAIFLPAFDGFDIHDVMMPFLEKGGCSVLLGETRAEYVARKMSHERLATETVAQFSECVQKLRTVCTDIIVAVDEELGGIRRLEGLVPPLPDLDEIAGMDEAAIEARCFDTARGARALGVTMFLAPIADVVDGRNPWLDGRSMGREPEAVARLVAAFVKGVQRAGITAVTKHFPGFNDLAGDPAVMDISLTTPLERILQNSLPFRAAISAGTKAVMAGPAPVVSIDPENAACTSPGVIKMLRQEFGFTGLIVSDDLDAPATMRGQSLLDTSIRSLNAGADLLLVAAGPHLDQLCNGIVEAVGTGRISEERLSQAASRVRASAAGI